MTPRRLRDRGHATRGTACCRAACRRAACRGATLVELLVALPLAMMAAAAAAVLLVRLSHTTRAQSSALATARELRHATRVLASDLEPLSGRDVHVVSDTLLQFAEQLGVLTLCEVPDAQTIIAAVPRGGGTQWVGLLRTGDRLRMWRPTAALRPPLASPRVLASAPVALAAGTCGTDPETGRRWRLVLVDSLEQGAAGTPVSLHRDVRYRHYRSGSTWWLGRQSRDGDTWETIQPVAGPLRAPANGGVSLTARAPDGHPLRIDASTADTARDSIAFVEVLVSMNRRTARTPGRAVDTVALLVPLRADAFRRR